MKEQKRMLSTTKAVQYLANKYSMHRTPATLKTWAEKHGIGHKLGGSDGQWVFDADKLDAFVLGEEGEHGQA